MVGPGTEALHVGAEARGVGDGAELSLPLALGLGGVVGVSAEGAVLGWEGAESQGEGAGQQLLHQSRLF